MILAKLINPQIFDIPGGMPAFFVNTMVIYDDATGKTLDRFDVDFPMSTPDSVVEEWVKQRAYEAALLAGQDQEKQGTLEWDWPAEMAA